MKSSLAILSDAHHLPGQPNTWEFFLNLLKNIPKPATLISLGDFFDIWYRPLKDHQGDYQELLQTIHQASRNGITFHFIVGNRDFLFTQADAAQIGVHLQSEPFDFAWQNTSLRLIHGDILLTEDKIYQRYRRWIRTPLIRQMARQAPLFFVDYFVKKIRQKSHQQKSLAPLNTYRINTQLAQDLLSDHQLMVCGHTHLPEVHSFSKGELHVLPAFGESGEYLTFQNKKWILSSELSR